MIALEVAIAAIVVMLCLCPLLLVIGALLLLWKDRS